MPNPSTSPSTSFLPEAGLLPLFLPEASFLPLFLPGAGLSGDSVIFSIEVNGLSILLKPLWAQANLQKLVFLLDGNNASMGLAGGLSVAVGLKDGRKAHGLILEATVTGPEGCLQFIAFTSPLCMVCVCQIQLDKTQHLVRPKRSRDLPLRWALAQKQRALALR